VLSIQTKNRFRLRADIINCIRNYLNSHQYLEVETPILVPSPGMEIHLDAFKIDPPKQATSTQLYLHTSPEYAMKKLLALGFNRIFQFCKVFRDEPLSSTHNPEFTMLEWYCLGEDYFHIMNEIEQWLPLVASEVLNKRYIKCNGHRIDLHPPFERVTVRELFRRYIDIDLFQIRDAKHFLQKARQKGCDIPDGNFWTYDDIFYQLFLDKIEPHLGCEKPVFVYQYPASMAALSKISEMDSRVCERFELYIGGYELANAFSELTDSKEQEARFKHEMIQREKLGKELYPLDRELLKALDHIDLTAKKAAGIAVGVDRLVMCLTERDRIEEVLLLKNQFFS